MLSRAQEWSELSWDRLSKMVRAVTDVQVGAACHPALSQQCSSPFCHSCQVLMNWRPKLRDAAAWICRCYSWKDPSTLCELNPLLSRWESGDHSRDLLQSQRSACLFVAEACKYSLTHVLCCKEFSFVFIIKLQLSLHYTSKCGCKVLLVLSTLPEWFWWRRGAGPVLPRQTDRPFISYRCWYPPLWFSFPVILSTYQPLVMLSLLRTLAKYMSWSCKSRWLCIKMEWKVC